MNFNNGGFFIKLNIKTIKDVYLTTLNDMLYKFKKPKYNIFFKIFNIIRKREPNKNTTFNLSIFIIFPQRFNLLQRKDFFLKTKPNLT